ncbi:MAG: hypothetical protein A2Z16_15505 [Chloroflexi bacterium RBG_16_54_18]|nr:MAG: hypothetical protein A2Z16_15505 [Chloroflexi bacterium RBG_16_54_18]
MRDHIKIIAWLYIILGVLGILGALIAFAIIAGGGVISGDETAIRITAIVAFVIGGIVVLVSVPGIITGLGLLNFKPWARILAIILALLNLPGFPIGTALGIYTLWAMLDSESSQLFNTIEG